jgi:transposase
VPTSPHGLAIFANSLCPDDHVALEATGNALVIARTLEPHVTRLWGSPVDLGVKPSQA